MTSRDTRSVERRAGDALAPAPAAAPFVTEDDECPGEVLVFAYGGYPTSLEVTSWGDTVPTLADARRWLSSYD